MAGLTPEALDELEALGGIYGDAFLAFPAEARCQVSVELGRGRELLARFLLPPGYPQAAPPFAELEARPRGAVGAEELEAASARLERAWEDGGREVALFAYVEWLRETFAQGDPEPEAEAAPTAADRTADGGETSDGGEWEDDMTPEEAMALAAIVEQSFRADREAKHAGKARAPDNGGNLEKRVAARIIHGEPFTERKSTFQGHVCPVESLEEVEMVMSILLENKKVAAATHNIMAFRIDVGKGVWAQDCDDDGETAAGGRLLRLLQVTGARNVCVVVSRWFGGTLLGPDRFKLINNCARDVLSENGFIASAGASSNKRP